MQESESNQPDPNDASIVGFYPVNLSDPKDREERLARGSSKLSFGVSFLDEALGGIYKDDLILLGAKTGLGKSQLAVLIALKNSRLGKRVHYFALEASKKEIERRLRYQRVCDLFFSKNVKPFLDLNFTDWQEGKLDFDLSEIENEIDNSDIKQKNLYVRYRDETGFDLEKLKIAFGFIKDKTDLVILDHLHYFDYEDTNDNRATKEIVKGVRDLSQLHNTPVILISHVRKNDFKNKRIIPDIDDFHGTSEISKIATRAITLAPEFSSSNKKSSVTIFQILKNRIDGSRSRWAARHEFIFKDQSYSNKYQIGNISLDGTEFKECLPGDKPLWAKSSIN